MIICNRLLLAGLALMATLPVFADESPAVTAEERSAVQLQPESFHPALTALAHRPLQHITLAEAVRPTVPVHSAPDYDSDHPMPLATPDVVVFPEAQVQLAGRNFTSVARPLRSTHQVCYQPLYFEDPNLERCGQSHGVFTDAVSAAHFFGRIPMVPYLVTARPPERCVAALPDCPMCQRFGHDAYMPPPTGLSVATQSAAVVGLIFLIP